MFESLSEKLSGILDKLTGRGALSEEDVNAAMREVRRALLEADVALEVVRSFVDRARTKAVGAAVIKSVKPGQMVVKIVHDSLVETLGGESQAIDLNAPAPVAIMLVGLQGAGKTTTAAKIAKRLPERDRRKVLMASLDVKRPAAQEQLAVLGRQVGVDTLPIVPGQDPVEIAKRAEAAARLQGYDVVLLDTAGRTHIDEPLMAGDGPDPRGGATARGAAGRRRADRPGRGQSRQELQRARRPDRHRAHPDRRRRARRRGPVDARRHRQADQAARRRRKDGRGRGFPSRRGSPTASSAWATSSALVEKAAQTIDAQQAAKMAEKMRKGVFDLNDLSEQLRRSRSSAAWAASWACCPASPRSRTSSPPPISTTSSSSASARSSRR